MQQMNTQKMRRRLTLRAATALVGVLTVASLLVGAAPTFADDALQAQQLVERARLSFENFTADPNFDALRDLLKTAKGVYIAPQVLRGAFIVGVSGGSGVLLARDEKAGAWGGLAFYTSDSAPAVTIAGREVPLEYEPTAALAYTLEGAPVWEFEMAGFLSGSFGLGVRDLASGLKLRPEDGIVFMTPYRPGKIPLVLVHGTASSPARWAKLVNELRSTHASPSATSSGGSSTTQATPPPTRARCSAMGCYTPFSSSTPKGRTPRSGRWS